MKSTVCTILSICIKQSHKVIQSLNSASLSDLYLLRNICPLQVMNRTVGTILSTCNKQSYEVLIQQVCQISTYSEIYVHYQSWKALCAHNPVHINQTVIQSMNSASPSDQYLQTNAIFILTFWILVWHYSISLPRNTWSVFELICIILCLHRARGSIFYHIQLCSQELAIQWFFCHARFWNKKQDSWYWSVNFMSQTERMAEVV